MITREPAGATETEELEKTRNALIDLQRALQQTYRETVPEMRIYGSQARKDATSSSDIDILLIYAHSVQPAKEISRLSVLSILRKMLENEGDFDSVASRAG